MNIIISKLSKTISLNDIECVERKGIGHPDSLADGIAEAISSTYSKYCLQEFGIVPAHWVDKCMLIGGECEIGFGFGKIVKPIKLYVVGKMTEYIGEKALPVHDLAVEATYNFLKRILTLINKDEIEVSLHINNAIGAGRPSSWYRPKNIDDIKKPYELTCNDASVCVAYAPLSATEKLVYLLEAYINGGEYKQANPEVGTDVKIIAHRFKDKVDLVMCIPFISSLTPSRSYYDEKKSTIKMHMLDFARRFNPDWDYSLDINTRDDSNTVYMTHLGTAADTGDIGVVGRGNRANGLISPHREMSIEAPCGKNPMYHSGKIYTVIAQLIADDVYESLALENAVIIISKTGNKINTPAFLDIQLSVDAKQYQTKVIHEVCYKHLKATNDISLDIIEGKYKLY